MATSKNLTSANLSHFPCERAWEYPLSGPITNNDEGKLVTPALSWGMIFLMEEL